MSLNIDEKKTIQRDKHSKYKTHDWLYLKITWLR